MIVLTGAAGGIGSAIAEKLSDESAVFGIDRASPRDWRGHFSLTDLNSERAIDSVCEEIADQRASISAIILATGTYLRCPIDRYDAEILNKVMWDNYYLNFFLLKKLLPRMVIEGHGRIVLISSQAAVTGGLDPGYASSKAAALALIKCIAREFGGRGIRANAVSPGPVTTPMSEVMGDERKRYYSNAIPIGRLATAEEVAEIAAFLATGAIDGINGATIDVDGGLVRR